MRIYRANIAQGVGDNIQAKCFGDEAIAQNKYDQIYYTHHPACVAIQKNNSLEYWEFLRQLGNLFFSKPPYIYNSGQHPWREPIDLARELGIIPQKPQQAEYVPLLCKGNSLNLGEEYIVITTKIRYFDRPTFYKLSIQLWKTLKLLAQKYKIVILGERAVEICSDYRYWGPNQIFGIYEQIISNLPTDRVLDLTVPALGITSPNIIKIQQDCLIMNEAKFVITLGCGGNLYLAAAVSNVIGYRADDDQLTNQTFQKNYSDTFISKDYNEFLAKLNSFI